MEKGRGLKITPLGDAALTVRIGAGESADPERCLREVWRVWQRLQTAELPGVCEVVPAFATVGVFYDPARVAEAGAPDDEIFSWLADRIQKSLKRQSVARRELSAAVVEIPVCYEEEFALDLRAVAEANGLSESEVIARHVGAEYRVACVGFAPGFPFLAGLPTALATPRRANPRARVPAGSVAIGGAQTGIYPQETPGGWNVIGRTPCRLFEANREPAALLAPGDAVRFRSITRAELEAFPA